ncbi:MAG: helix-turn-helix transcriptional regulator [Bacilli bacterium]|nr:helix-turn-helix transcriptional regulator [Bacilli bacterium]
MFYNLKKVRESYDLTQRDMAKLLKVSKSSYNYFETGEHIIPLKHLNNFCNTFQVSMDYVCGLTKVNVKSTKKYKLNSKVIGLNLKKIRLKNKLTQSDIANILNTSQSNISSYESGKTLILTAFIYSFAKHFNVSLDYLTNRSIDILIKKKN